MLNRKLRLNFDRCLAGCFFIAAFVLVTSFSVRTLGQGESPDQLDKDTPSDFDNPEGLVELHVKADPNAPYFYRRTNWSWRFNILWEQFYPNSYVSLVDAATYANIFGSNQGSIASAGLGVQYNTRIGAFYLDTIYGAGSISGSIGGVTSGFVVSKYGATFGLLLDTIVDNPYVSPFVGVQAIYFNWQEISTNISIGGTTAVTIGTVAGLSIHLNRIDISSAQSSYIDDGIKNTFLDIYGVQYNTSSSPTDPDLQTTWNVGAGFRLEF